MNQNAVWIWVSILVLFLGAVGAYCWSCCQEEHLQEGLDGDASAKDSGTESLPNPLGVLGHPMGSQPLPIPTNTGVIPMGYYHVPNSNQMAVVPHGYEVYPRDASGNGPLIPTSSNAIYSAAANGNTPPPVSATQYDSRAVYDPGNYNVQYHDSAPELQNSLGLPNQGTWVADKDGKLVYIPWSDISANVTYYTSGAYPYGASTYVPNYEESVYLSKTSGQATTSTYLDAASQMGGFCSQDAPNAEKVEQSCAALSVNQCASTTCCVLLGGAKCVAGSVQGPKQGANYSDPFLINKDFYYYQGKCYGNCNTPTSSKTSATAGEVSWQTVTPAPTTIPVVVETTTPVPTTTAPPTTTLPNTVTIPSPVPTTTPFTVPITTTPIPTSPKPKTYNTPPALASYM